MSIDAKSEYPLPSSVLISQSNLYSWDSGGLIQEQPDLLLLYLLRWANINYLPNYLYRKWWGTKASRRRLLHSQLLRGEENTSQIGQLTFKKQCVL